MKAVAVQLYGLPNDTSSHLRVPIQNKYAFFELEGQLFSCCAMRN